MRGLNASRRKTKVVWEVMSTGIAANKGAEVFGTISVAMVTPFASDGSIDVNRGVEIATHLASRAVTLLFSPAPPGSPRRCAARKSWTCSEQYVLNSVIQ